MSVCSSEQYACVCLPQLVRMCLRPGTLMKTDIEQPNTQSPHTLQAHQSRAPPSSAQNTAGLLQPLLGYLAGQPTQSGGPAPLAVNTGSACSVTTPKTQLRACRNSPFGFPRKPARYKMLQLEWKAASLSPNVLLSKQYQCTIMR
jgi:hypothetical protein